LSSLKEKKQEAVNKYRLHDSDTGSVEVQVALLTMRIEQLTGHLKNHTKDLHSRYGLLKMADLEAYRALIENLNLRK
jgi:small subunit ribosomal protein S15